MRRKRNDLRVFYATGGPGDVIASYKEQFQENAGDAQLISDVSVGFSTQFVEACLAVGASAYIVSPHKRKETISDGLFIFEHRPKPEACDRGGLLWHFGTIHYQFGLIRSALRYRANIAVIAEANHYWLWFLAAIAGIRIIPVMHCTFWPSGFRPMGIIARILQWLNGWFWRRYTYASIVVSPECKRQILEIARNTCGPIHIGLSLYNRKLFSTIPPPPTATSPFCIMFAGRIERAKGVFDLLDIASALEARNSHGRFLFELCGDGSAIDELRDQILERGLDSTVRLAGRLNRNQMMEAYGRSHAVIVPTTSQFSEGLCQVAAESILAGRPLISSRLCHALDLVGDATVETIPDDIESYIDAIQELADDTELYISKRIACARLSEPFLDPDRSWGHALYTVLIQIKNMS